MHTASSHAAVAAVARTGPRVHLVIGPVGAGKSTFARQLVYLHRAVPLNLDDWMATLFSADRPGQPGADVMAWYVPRTLRCLAQIWKTAEAVLHAGGDVVLEVGLIQQHQRDAFYARMGPWADAMVVYVLDAPREVRRARVLRRNAEQGATFSMVVPPHIFELASDLWQPPDEVECANRSVVWVPVADHRA
ncbi:putative kinase [Acidovorax delafieldii]|uniref:Putative kinase n=1 Tax=Acidovorax delafieldii TaxID=47920 RepID=A0A561XF33_ACIDE|nr:ATP-binding protein [Acidovorax delafieldii]TWG34682.1 putative kinase [Acidovorax delafieldii]